MPVFARRALCLWLAAAPWVGAVRAAEPQVPEVDARAIRQLIEAQLAAFRADNAEQAFAYASPSIRDQFGNAATFLTMVRSGYPVVYRPASVAFLLPQAGRGEVIQRVRLTDQAGAAWLAIYSLQRQPDKSWRINGCVVAPDTGRTA